MRAAVLVSKNDVHVKNVDKPQPNADEVLIKVHYTGICGSDIPRVFEGRVHGYPIVLGHEFSGLVEGVGSAVDPFLLGKRVAGIPLIPCGVCPDCSKGYFSLCKQYSFVGSRRGGSMAEYVCLPANNVFVVASSVSDLEATFFEPATVALHALELAKFTAGATALVMGAGTIGLLLAQALLAYGAQTVVVCNRSEARLDCVRQLHDLTPLCSAEHEWKSNALQLTQNQGFDFVFDTVANSKTIADCTSVAGSRGVVCFVGTPKDDVTLSVSEWETLNRKELTVTGSWMSYSAPWPGVEWEKASDLFSTGQLKIIDDMIDGIYNLGHVREGFDRFLSSRSLTGKVLIDSWGA